MEVRRGDLLFFYPERHNIADWFICRYSGKYVHCGLYLGHNLMISARWRKGIDFDLLSEYKKKYDAYRIKRVNYTQLDRMIWFAISLRGKKYDKKQALSVPFFKLFSNSDYYFCSEFLSYILIYYGLIPSKHLERMSPTELANQNFLTLLK